MGSCKIRMCSQRVSLLRGSCSKQLRKFKTFFFLFKSFYSIGAQPMKFITPVLSCNNSFDIKERKPLSTRKRYLNLTMRNDIFNFHVFFKRYVSSEFKFTKRFLQLHPDNSNCQGNLKFLRITEISKKRPKTLD